AEQRLGHARRGHPRHGRRAVLRPQRCGERCRRPRVPADHALQGAGAELLGDDLLRDHPQGHDPGGRLRFDRARVHRRDDHRGGGGHLPLQLPRLVRARPGHGHAVDRVPQRRPHGRPGARARTGADRRRPRGRQHREVRRRRVMAARPAPASPAAPPGSRGARPGGAPARLRFFAVFVGRAPPRSRGARPVLSPSRLLFFAVFLGLPLLLYLVIVVWPVAQAVYYSLTDWRGLAAAPKFIGLDNYVTLFQDPTLLKALTNNLVLLVVLPTVVIVLAFALAVLVTVGGSSRGEIRGVRGA